MRSALHEAAWTGWDEDDWDDSVDPFRQRYRVVKRGPDSATVRDVRSGQEGRYDPGTGEFVGGGSLRLPPEHVLRLLGPDEGVQLRLPSMRESFLLREATTKCPLCGAKGYQGLNDFECPNPDCKNHMPLVGGGENDGSMPVVPSVPRAPYLQRAGGAKKWIVKEFNIRDEDRDHPIYYGPFDSQKKAEDWIKQVGIPGLLGDMGEEDISEFDPEDLFEVDVIRI